MKKLFYIFAGLMVGIFTVGIAFAARTAVMTPGISQIPITGTCNVASTTLFSIANPFAGTSFATSTVIYGEIYGTNGATTTDIVIGTSTAAGLPMTNTFSSGLKANFLALSSVATSTQFFAIAGEIKYSFAQATTTTALGAAAVQQPSIILGPTDVLYGYATSTYAGQGNGNTTAATAPTPSSCTYKFIIAN